MWRRRRGSYGGGGTADSPSLFSSSSSTATSLTGFPANTTNATTSAGTPGGNSFFGSDPKAADRPLVFDIEVPTPGPLGLDLRARHIERDKPQRGAIVKGFRPLEGGRKGFVEETGRVKVGDILQVIHKMEIDDLPFDQIVNHAIQLQKDPTAWPLRMEFRRDPGSNAEFNTPNRPRRGSFFRSSLIGTVANSSPVQDSNFNEKLQYFRGFFANRIPTGGAAPKAMEKPPVPPSIETVNEMYRELLVKRGVPDDVMDELVRIESLETKWHAVWYAQQHENEEHKQSHSAEAARFAENLVELQWDNKGLRDLETLRNKISVGSTEWLEAFLANFGLDYLTMKLPDPSPFPIEHSKYEKATRICEMILRILRALTHFPAGVEAITNVPGLVKRVALCFHTENGDLKKYTLQLLGIVCYNSAAGHQAVIEAFNHYKETKGETTRFSCLRDALKSTRYSLVFKEDVLSFVNIIVNKAIRLEDRLAIRNDFMALNMAGYFEEIRAKSLAVQRKKYPDVTEPMEPTASSSPALGPIPATKEPKKSGSSGVRVTNADSSTVSSQVEARLSRVSNVFDQSRSTRRSSISKSAPSSPVDRSGPSTYSPTYVPTRTSLPKDVGGSSTGNASSGTRSSLTMGGTIISSNVTQLRNQLDNMEKQIDVFERFMEDDRKDTIYEKTDLASIDSVFNTLKESVSNDTELQACILSIMQQLLFIPGDRVIGKEMWALCERLMKQVSLLAPVEEVRNFELGYEDRKTLLRIRDRYTEFLQKCADEDPTFRFHIGPVILIENRRRDSDLALSDDTDELTDDEDAAPEEVMAKDHPNLMKYFKLLKMGMPLEHVQTKMSSEVQDFDISILETPEKVIRIGKPHEDTAKKGTRAEEHTKYAKYFKLKKMGMPLPHIQMKMSVEGLDGSILETPDLLLDEDGNEWSEGSDEKSEFAGIAVKDHEKFAKYFKLMKMGMPLEHVKLKASAEGLDESLLETPEQLLDKDGKKFVPAASKQTGIAVKNHEKFAKFFKLMKMGMPLEHIKLKASAEGLDGNLLDTPDALLNEDGTKFVGAEDSTSHKGTPVKDHEKFAKFFKLLKMGMPMEHVKLKASSEGLDGNLLETPEKLVDSEGKEVVAALEQPKGIPVKDHEKFAKFFKLMKMGMPLEHVKLKVSSEGLDAHLLDTPDKLLDADGKEIVEKTTVEGIPVKEHEKFAKFFKLMKMGMPLDHVKLKANAEGLDGNLLDTPDKLLDTDGKELVDTSAVKGIPVKEHDKFAKFFKLMKMGMPLEHVKLKASAEGLDGNLLETPDKLVDDDGKEVKEGGRMFKASEHPSYAKYFKLLKMGMPRPQVELKMGAEGLDSKHLDTPDAMIPEHASAKLVPVKPVVAAPPKPKLRNLYWEVVKEEVAAGTIWEKFSKPEDTAPATDIMSVLAKAKAQQQKEAQKDAVLDKYVEKLADIFVNKPAKAKESADEKKPTKKRAATRVALIDVKRANNIGIMLARFRLPYYKIRNAILLVDKEILSVEKVSALIQFAPEDEELETVKNYTGDRKLLGDAEQYFAEILCVPRISTRLQAIHATWQFDTYVEEQQKLMQSVSNACRELKASVHLQEIFRVVLSLGNALNDGTARGGAKGFRLNILLKLNQVKASDNSITLLNYVANVLRAKDPAILEFDKELPSVESASRVTIQVLKAGENAVRKAASLICDELEMHAKLPVAEYPQPEPEEGEAPVVITDRFQEVVGPFAERAKKVSEGIVVELDNMMKSFEDAVTYYGEDPSNPECGPDSFFSIFYSFAKLLQSADRDNERKRIAEERRIRREEETKKRLEALKKKKASSSFASLKAGDVDDIVMKIRAKRVEERRKELLGKSFDSDTGSFRSSSSSRTNTNASLQRNVESKPVEASSVVANEIYVDCGAKMEYVAYAEAIESKIAQFLEETHICVQPAARFVSCERFPEHFLPVEALETHWRKSHGEKYDVHASHEFFYGKASDVQRVELGEIDLQIVHQQEEKEEEIKTDEYEAYSLLESTGSSEASANTGERISPNAADRIIEAIKQIAVDVRDFYVHVQQWKRIPRVFAYLAWDNKVLERKTIQGWLIAELSRTVFRDEPLEMELVDYIVGLLEHPEFCQPDLLTLELAEFLGKDVRRLVLALWKFLVIEIGMRVVFKVTKEGVEKQLATQQEAERAAKVAKRSSIAVDKDTQGEDTTEIRNYKRRRPSYRGKASGKSGQVAVRDLLGKQMLELSMETGRKLVGHEDSNGDVTISERRGQIGTLGSDWMLFTNALRTRDWDRHEDGHQTDERRQTSRYDDVRGRDEHRKRVLRSLSRDRSIENQHYHRHHRRSSSRNATHKRHRSRSRSPLRREARSENRRYFHSRAR